MKLIDDEEFIAAWNASGGSPVAVSKTTGISEREVHKRRRRLEGKYGITLAGKGPGSSPRLVSNVVVKKHAGKIEQGVTDGVVIVFSDAHFWPGFKTTAHRALIAMIRHLQPNTIVCNGDAFDGATISRWPRPFFDESKPQVMDELKIVGERLDEIEAACPKAERIWCLGNHDLRYEAKLAAQAPEFQGVRGFHLKDHFPTWRPCWSYWINEDVEIRHRYRGGIHATHNNVMANHHSTITGHLHSLQVRPYTDGRGRVKYGVDTGTLADPNGPQFMDYLEGRQANWRSGFIVLTFRDGEMLMPEIILKRDEDHVEFRGHILHADTLEIT